MGAEPGGLRVSYIEVKGLFGLVDHHIPLNSSERVTIIHGPNGIGKTRVLELVEALFARSLRGLASAPYDKLVVGLSDASILSVSQERGRKDWLIVSRVDPGGEERWGHRLNLEWVFAWPERGREEGPEGSFARQVAAKLHRARDGGGPQSASRLRRLIPELPVLRIQAQRLHHPGPSPEVETPTAEPGPAVQRCASALGAGLERALATYAERAQALDQSFPQRLLRLLGSPPPLHALKQRYQEIEARRERLVSLGLLDGATPEGAAPLDWEAVQPAQLPVLSLYVEDTGEKLRVLEELAGPVEILLRNLNEKFMHKRARLDREQGLVVELVDGREVPLDALSSGEQHEVVLLFELLFRTAPDTLVLIDEPELSLHLLWQKGFMDDLLEITRAARIDALVATHSPFIVGEREDLMVDLSPGAPRMA